MPDIQAAKIDSSHVHEELVRELLKERRRDRRWRNIRFFIGFAFILFIIGAMTMSETEPPIVGHGSNGYVALIRLDGMIGPGSAFSAEAVLPILRDAFDDKKAKGVILDINSGGGTPVQASIIHDEIVRLKKKYNKKVVVIGEDLLASGAYFVAVSGDKIYVNPNTVTGSIGVIMQGFGLEDAIKKFGVKRRVYTSGDHKDRLDPFLPQSKEDIQKIQNVINEVHNNFNDVVMQGRKGKLRGDKKELFSGDFWTGQTALKLGLVDGLGNISEVLQEEFHVSNYKDYTESGNVLKSVLNQIGSTLNLPAQSEHLHLLEKF